MNNESPKTPEEQENLKNRILQNTPDGYDPIIYWHQVAIDVLRSQERNAKKRIEEQNELLRLRRLEERQKELQISKLQYDALPNFKYLLECVHKGDFSMNVSLAFYPNNDRNDSRNGGCSDDE